MSGQHFSFDQSFWSCVSAWTSSCLRLVLTISLRQLAHYSTHASACRYFFSPSPTSVLLLIPPSSPPCQPPACPEKRLKVQKKSNAVARSVFDGRGGDAITRSGVM